MDQEVIDTALPTGETSAAKLAAANRELARVNNQLEMVLQNAERARAAQPSSVVGKAVAQAQAKSAEVANVEAQIAEIRAESAALTIELDARRQEVELIDQRIAEHSQALAEIHSTKAWGLAAPLRAITKLRRRAG